MSKKFIILTTVGLILGLTGAAILIFAPKSINYQIKQGVFKKEKI